MMAIERSSFPQWLRGAAVIALLPAFCACAEALGQDAPAFPPSGYKPGASPYTLITHTGYWAYALMALVGGIVLTILPSTLVFFKQVLRCAQRKNFAYLPDALDADGLIDLRDTPLSRKSPVLPLRRALRAGLVSGRGGLLVSKSAVLAAWETQRASFRFWPRMAACLGVVSLVLCLVAGLQVIGPSLTYWNVAVQREEMPDMARIAPLFDYAYAFLLCGMTTCFISVLLFFGFDFAIQNRFNAATLLLVDYLGAADERDAFAPAARVGAPAESLHSDR